MRQPNRHLIQFSLIRPRFFWDTFPREKMLRITFPHKWRASRTSLGQQATISNNSRLSARFFFLVTFRGDGCNSGPAISPHYVLKNPAESRKKFTEDELTGNCFAQKIVEFSSPPIAQSFSFRNDRGSLAIGKRVALRLRVAPRFRTGANFPATSSVASPAVAGNEGRGFVLASCPRSCA